MIALFISLSLFAAEWKNDLASLKELASNSSSIAETLQKLPDEFKLNALVMFRSASLQNATCEHPRIILFSNDGHLVLTFNGSPDQEGYETIEAREFDPIKRRFNFEEITNKSDYEMRKLAIEIKHKYQPKTRKDKLESLENRQGREGTNAAACMACHAPSNPQGKDGRDNWRPYPIWPGALGACRDTMTPGYFDDKTPSEEIFKSVSHFSCDLDRSLLGSRGPSKTCIDQFRSSWKKNERYKKIAPALDYLMQKESKDVQIQTFNAAYTTVSFKLHAQRLVRIIQESPEKDVLEAKLLHERVCKRPAHGVVSRNKHLNTQLPSDVFSNNDVESENDGVNGHAISDYAARELLSSSKRWGPKIQIIEGPPREGTPPSSAINPQLKDVRLQYQVDDRRSVCAELKEAMNTTASTSSQPSSGAR